MKAYVRLIYRYPIMFVILVRHLINPFGSLASTKGKMKDRFTNWEKRFFINTAYDKEIKKYFTKILF